MRLFLRHRATCILAMSAKEDAKRFTVDGPAYREKPAFVHLTSWLHRVLPLSWQRGFRDRAFRRVADGGAVVTAGVTAVLKPYLVSRFVGVSRRKENHRYGPHPRQVIEVVKAIEEAVNGSATGNGRLVVFVHGGAWGSGSTWMYRVMVDRLAQIGYTVANIGYRVYPDGDTNTQVEDLAAAIRWMSTNLDLLGFDGDIDDGSEAVDYSMGEASTRNAPHETNTSIGTGSGPPLEGQAPGKGAMPEVYLMGHSSGAHVSLLYLIRRAERERDVATIEGTVTHTGANGQEGDKGFKELSVEGLIGLAGVYDIYRHYLYESWRGVHEISPMKASHGGLLHTLFDYSHPFLLGGRPGRPRPPPSTAPDKGISNMEPATSNTSVRSSLLVDSSLEVKMNEGCDLLVGDAPETSLSKREAEMCWNGVSEEDGKITRENKLWLGQQLPRTLLWHGTADSTVPFSQTSEAAEALRSLGVPTTTFFAPGGEHFDPVGQLMFSEGSDVEKSIVEFTSRGALDDAMRQRKDFSSPFPPSKL